MSNTELLAKIHYDKYCNCYETECNRDFYGYFCGEMLQKLQSSSFKNILEIGCGTGISTEKIASQFKGSQIHAFDISKKMLEFAQKKPLLKNVSFYQKIEELPLDISFDLIISNFSYHWWSRSFCQRIKSLAGNQSQFAICAPSRKGRFASGNLAIAKTLQNLNPSRAAKTGKLAGVTSDELKGDFPGYKFKISKITLAEVFNKKREFIETLKVRGSFVAIANTFGVPKLELENCLLQYLDNNGSEIKMHWEAIVALKSVSGKGVR